MDEELPAHHEGLVVHMERLVRVRIPRAKVLEDETDSMSFRLQQILLNDRQGRSSPKKVKFPRNRNQL